MHKCGIGGNGGGNDPAVADREVVGCLDLDSLFKDRMSCIYSPDRQQREIFREFIRCFFADIFP